MINAKYIVYNKNQYKKFIILLVGIINDFNRNNSLKCI